jgi:hypothetical protein
VFTKIPFHDIQRIAQQISRNLFGFIHHEPEPWARPACCFENVLRKVEISGGQGVSGWTFHYRSNPEFGGYVFVTHHGVWGAPDRRLIDVTPFHDEQAHHPFALNGEVLFLVDETAKPVELASDNAAAIAPLPSRFFALGNGLEIMRYVQKLNDHEQRKCEQIYANVKLRLGQH